MRLLTLLSFALGCAITLAAFGIGWADWGGLSNQEPVMQILMVCLGALFLLLTAAGILGKGKERWLALTFGAALLVGFSGLVFFSVGIFFATFAVFFLVFCVVRLRQQHRASG